MDATANTVPKEFDVKGYPTLYFLSSKSKKPVPYNGEREADEMAKFIKENKGKWESIWSKRSRSGDRSKWSKKASQ